MAKPGVRIKFNKGWGEPILKSPGVLADLAARARAVANEAGEGFEASAEVGKGRARASVITATTEARIAEASDHTLTKAIDAAR